MINHPHKPLANTEYMVLRGTLSGPWLGKALAPLYRQMSVSLACPGLNNEQISGLRGRTMRWHRCVSDINFA